MPTDPDSEKRAQSDRRQSPTSAWSAFVPTGKRMAARRAAEHRRPYFVDRFSVWMFVFILLLLFASLTDAVLTIYVLQAGGDEINPVMGHLLSYGVMAFVLGKYLLTVFGLPLLLIFKNYYLFGTRLRVGHLIAVLVALYAVLIGYQVYLIHNHIGWQQFQ
jgi:hypothetical protein